ncbi:hypothetical protein [Actinomadura verrucosospora]|uniref:Peptidase M1 membrane alanine aminopeptidase n=1 Tax=Actinomadura verrucosospora TaxID=46165 RepID=A0A7D3ZLU7_ACTVE|nr:hypothetical protein [Actinomadura verrucosospora]QKG21622.1 Peptidase M1 membrane alanine aminopeptidase [Actinomadura verrucosospora]
MKPFHGISRIGRCKAAAALGVAVAALAVVATAAPASAAAAPSTSPSVSHKYYGNPANIPPCRSGHACAIVAYGRGYYVFDFYKYGGYSLRHWRGRGGLTNVQTRGAAVRVYDARGRQIDCLRAARITYEVDWNPAWKIRLTANGC